MHLLGLSNISVELDWYDDIVPWELPRIEVKPVIRHLDLVSIDQLLLEDTISIP